MTVDGELTAFWYMAFDLLDQLFYSFNLHGEYLLVRK
jgi:hypothetical protein